MPKVSVIIPTYERCHSVKRLLNALDNQTFPDCDFEVIVSIDGSEDGTREMVDNYKSSYELICIWEQNSGRASARNRAINTATGEVLIMLDDDMEPAPGLIEAHYELHNSKSKIAVLGPAPVFVDSLSSPITKYKAIKFNSHLKRISKPGYKIKIWDFYSGNFSVRKNLMTEMGLFNESFKIYGNEDVELAFRFLQNGVEIVFSEKALSTQHYEKDFNGLTADTISEGKTAVQLAILNPETFYRINLCHYNVIDWRWRPIRRVLLELSLYLRILPELAKTLVIAVEKTAPSKVRPFYNLSLDYFYWLGVWTALKINYKNRELKSRIISNRTYE